MHNAWLSESQWILELHYCWIEYLQRRILIKLNQEHKNLPLFQIQIGLQFLANHYWDYHSFTCPWVVYHAKPWDGHPWNSLRCYFPWPQINQTLSSLSLRIHLLCLAHQSHRKMSLNVLHNLSFSLLFLINSNLNWLKNEIN